jgi:hypothetical protein
MTTTARDYLVERFESDAAMLRERVAVLARGTKVAGPDAATSRGMADGCEEVAAMLRAIVSTGEATRDLEAVMALVPLLEHRAAESKLLPAVRAVYVGAATRIREVWLAEARLAEAALANGDAPEDADADADGPDDDDSLDEMA